MGLEEEFFRQGDLEKEAMIAVSPLMDRKKAGITKSQPGVRGRGAGGYAESGGAVSGIIVFSPLRGFISLFSGSPYE